MISTANIINTGDALFEIYRVFKESRFEGIDSELIKEFCDEIYCDKVFKKDGHYIFVREIKNAEIDE